jgi:hypothetical protein
LSRAVVSRRETTRAICPFFIIDINKYMCVHISMSAHIARRAHGRVAMPALLDKIQRADRSATHESSRRRAARQPRVARQLRAARQPRVARQPRAARQPKYQRANRMVGRMVGAVARWISSAAVSPCPRRVAAPRRSPSRDCARHGLATPPCVTSLRYRVTRGPSP